MPMIDLDAAILAIQKARGAMLSGKKEGGWPAFMEDELRALPTVQPEPAPALGAEWMRREAANAVSHHLYWQSAQRAIWLIPGPTHEQLLADALALTEVKALQDAFTELLATVKGECPSLLNEDSGGSAVLIGLVEAALAKLKGASHE
jgi:hypothetical protein